MRDLIRNPVNPAHYWFAGVVGIAALALAIAISTLVPIDSPPDLTAVLPNVLVLSAILLLPASIFPPVVGSMFPKYWRATPVTVIRRGPMYWLLVVLTATLAYGAGSLVATEVLPLSQTWLVPLVLISVVGLLVIQSMWLIGYSMSILDPDRLITYLQRVGVGGNHDVTRTAFNDLCRLTRGLKDEERPTAAQHAIESLAQVHAKRAGALGESERGLAARVLSDCKRDWEAGRSPTFTHAIAAVDACWSAMGLTGADREG